METSWTRDAGREWAHLKKVLSSKGHLEVVDTELLRN